VAVKLRDVLEAMEYPEEWECYVNPSTGEIIAITDEERDYVDDPDADISDLAEWLQESIRKGREAMESLDVIALPSKFDVHEWEIMRRYAASLEEPERSELLDAIHGTGAFRLFRITTDRLGLRDDWLRFRDEALKRFAIDWLNEHRIEYTES
jgi:hypothetical protein